MEPSCERSGTTGGECWLFAALSWFLPLAVHTYVSQDGPTLKPKTGGPQKGSSDYRSFRGEQREGEHPGVLLAEVDDLLEARGRPFIVLFEYPCTGH